MCAYSVARTFHPDGPKPRIPVYGPPRPRCGCGLRARPPTRGAGRPGPAPTPAAGSPTRSASPRSPRGHRDRPAADHGRAHEPPGGDVRLPARARGAGRWPTRPTPARPTRWWSWPVTPTCCCARRRSSSRPTPTARRPARGLHLTGRQAGQHAARAGAGQLVLTHLGPWNDKDSTLDEAGPGLRRAAVPGRARAGLRARLSTKPSFGVFRVLLAGHALRGACLTLPCGYSSPAGPASSAHT